MLTLSFRTSDCAHFKHSFLIPNQDFSATHVAMDDFHITRPQDLPAAPKEFAYIPYDKPASQSFDTPPVASPWLNSWPVAEKSSHERRHKRHSKKRSKHRSKKHRKSQFAAYLLQFIGLICLIMAAVKAFEPLTGVGFTMVLIGYDRGLKKKLLPGKLSLVILICG